VPEHAVAGLEARDGASDFGHGARDVRAQGEWEGDPGEERLAHGLDGPVDGVDGHGGVLDDDFVVLWGRVWRRGYFERGVFGAEPGGCVGGHGGRGQEGRL